MFGNLCLTMHRGDLVTIHDAEGNQIGRVKVYRLTHQTARIAFQFEPDLTILRIGIEHDPQKTLERTRENETQPV